MKNCDGGGYCSYKDQEGSLMRCKYEGYCDFQLPRDSRMQPHWDFNRKELYDEQTKLPYPHEYCPYCHLPLSQCRGHTICKKED